MDIRCQTKQTKKGGIIMVAKKSLLFGVSLLVITVWICGSATPALSETINCKGEGKAGVLKMINDSMGYFIGLNENEVSYTCDNGESFTEIAYLVWDLLMGKERQILGQGNSISTYKDNSKIIGKLKFSLIPDPKDEKQWIIDGTAEIIRGTMRFNGIKGSVSFKGKQDAGMKLFIESTMTYTLTTK
jgi:hypothetical protein